MEIYYNLVESITGNLPKNDNHAKAELRAFLAANDALDDLFDQNNPVLMVEVASIYADAVDEIPQELYYYFEKEVEYKGPEGEFDCQTESFTKRKLLENIKAEILDAHIDLTCSEGKEMMFHRDHNIFSLSKFKAVRGSGLLCSLNIIGVEKDQLSLLIIDKFIHTKKWRSVKRARRQRVTSPNWSKGQILEVLENRKIINNLR